MLHHRSGGSPNFCLGLTRKHGVTRTQALRLAPADMTRQVANSTLRTLLEQVAQDTTSIMVFVGSLHSDSQRPGEKHQSDERVAERARPRFQPARARGPDSLIVDRAQAHQRRHRHEPGDL